MLRLSVLAVGDAEQTSPLRASPEALARPNLDPRKEDNRLGPRAEYSPHQVAALVLQVRCVAMGIAPGTI